MAIAFSIFLAFCLTLTAWSDKLG